MTMIMPKPEHLAGLSPTETAKEELYRYCAEIQGMTYTQYILKCMRGDRWFGDRNELPIRLWLKGCRDDGQ